MKTEKYTIESQNAITILNVKLSPCPQQDAKLQLESYTARAGGAPRKIGAFNPASSKFQYNKGDIVEVVDKIVLNNAAMLTNVIMNGYKLEY
jgi:hypothetical protein